MKRSFQLLICIILFSICLAAVSNADDKKLTLGVLKIHSKTEMQHVLTAAIW